ncbi:MAG: NAD(P)H-hydrate dehydratase [Ilumatobacteraceae bacterium]
MRPIVTPKQMRVIDHEAATAGVPVDELVARAGAAVARTARHMMGGVYGRTVVVVAGPGNNGADGRVAARLLADQGARVTMLDAGRLPLRLPRGDLLIDAAFGTGFRGQWDPPDTRGMPVLAVDIPSGVDGLTGVASTAAWAAARTVTFVALKPGLLMGAGRELSGEVEVADIGIKFGLGAVAVNEVEAADVERWIPRRPRSAHKWQSALYVVAGSGPMMGAARLCTGGAMRMGAGIVHLATPGVVSDRSTPNEVVRRPLPALGWSKDVLTGAERFRALVLGPGLGRDDGIATEARKVIAGWDRPMVIDGDGLFAVAWGGDGARDLVRSRASATVVTPHDGEYAMVLGHPPTTDRIDSARKLATDLNCVCLLKGPTTVVAEPSGEALVITSADERLATAGTGDVLAGMIGAMLARGAAPFEAAAAAAWVHGRAAARFPHREGLVASDLIDLLPAVIDETRSR